jgi:hypothetical protein
LESDAAGRASSGARAGVILNLVAPIPVISNSTAARSLWGAALYPIGNARKWNKIQERTAGHRTLGKQDRRSTTRTRRENHQ